MYSANDFFMRLVQCVFRQLILCFIFASGMAQPSIFSPKGIGGGGALFFPKINPSNDNEFYVSCDMSQLFHTSDYGKNYSQVHFSKLQVANTSTYEYTKDNNIAYCTFTIQQFLTVLKESTVNHALIYSISARLRPKLMTAYNSHLEIKAGRSVSLIP